MKFANKIIDPPPLKEFPAEYLSEDSNISEDTEYATKKTALVEKVKEFRDNYFDDQLLIESLETAYIKLSEMKPHKAEQKKKEE